MKAKYDLVLIVKLDVDKHTWAMQCFVTFLFFPMVDIMKLDPKSLSEKVISQNVI